MNETEEIYMCDDCKSENVAHLEWVHLNEEDSCGDQARLAHDDTEYYCLDCKSTRVWQKEVK